MDIHGLSSSEAQKLLAQYGCNEIVQKNTSFFRTVFAKLWGPIPWTLEAAILLEAAFGRVSEPIIIAILLLLSASFGAMQNFKAQKALDYLRSRLQIKSRVLRDNAWQLIAANELVPGDLIHVQVGDLIPADCIIVQGTIEADQSVLTGESIPLIRTIDETIYSGSVVCHGDALAKVSATGAHSYFGQTAELIKTVHPKGHLEELLLSIVRYLVIINTALATLLILAILYQGLHLIPLIPLFLILVMATLPITMPSAFIAANAVEAQMLAKKEGVLVTGLSAVQEAACMNILCVDKTGTLTQNKQSLIAIIPFLEQTEKELLELAQSISDPLSQNPLDQAIVEACRKRSIFPSPPVQLTPFDPIKKYAESSIKKEHNLLHVIMGFPQAIEQLSAPNPQLQSQVEILNRQGARVLAIASGDNKPFTLQGLLVFADTPREDAAQLIQTLRELNLRIFMITGDNQLTAQTVGKSIGLGDRFSDLETSLKNPLEYDGFASCYPKDKLSIVRQLQTQGRVGMTGDGINDAPALKQAEVGIAVSTATDVAKASSQIILMQPGLQGIIAIILAGHRVYRRMFSWTVIKITRTVQLMALVTLGFIFTRVFVMPLFLIVLFIVMNDLITMTIATDRAQISLTPEQWNMKPIAKLSSLLALSWLGLGGILLWMGFTIFSFSTSQIQTMTFLYLVYTSQATIYLARTHGHFWSFAPSKPILFVTLSNLLLALIFTAFGVFMTPIPSYCLVIVLLSIALTMWLLDAIKVRLKI